MNHTASPVPLPHDTLESLPSDRQEKLAELLDECLRRLESGQSFDLEAIEAEHPDLAKPLKTYLQSLNFLHSAVRNQKAAPRELVAPFAPSDEPRLGDYRLVREVGRGGMGIVYEAWQISLGRRVALKVLPFAAVLDERQIARFQNEAHAAAQLQHAHIVPVYAVGCERGVHFYSMRFIDGDSLEYLIADLRGTHVTETVEKTAPAPENLSSPTVKKTQSDADGFQSNPVRADHTPEAQQTTGDVRGRAAVFAETLRNPSTLQSIRSRNYIRSIVEIAIQAAEAMSYAHDNGVIHRDIKPSNLMLDRFGQLWVTDFGLARVKSGQDLTRAGELLGTVRYMSPEQAVGQTHLVDHRTDIYSLGATLYELLTLHAAFDGTDREQIVTRITSSDMTAPRKRNPAISVDLETIVLKAMSKCRDDRYDRADELAEDLRRFLDGRPTLARRLTPVDRFARYAVRHSRICMAVASIALILLVGLTSVAISMARKNTQVTTARHNATLHLNVAQSVVQRFDSAVVERLERIPGTEDVRAELLLEAIRYYESFAEYAADDAQLQSELAQAHMRLGALHDRLGSIHRALDSYQTARELLLHAAIESADPLDAVDLQAQAAMAEHNRGVLLTQFGRFSDAEIAYRTALREQSSLFDANPNDSQRAYELAVTHFNLGRMQMQINLQSEAQVSLHTAESMLQRLVRASSHNRDYARSLAAAANALSGLDSLPIESRIASLQVAIETYSTWSAHDPQDQDSPHLLALAYNNLGSLWSECEANESQVIHGRVTAAFRSAIDLQKDLVQASPQVVNYQLELATTWNNLGQWYLQQGQWHDAELALFEAKDQLEPFCTQRPEMAIYRSSLGGVLHNLAIVNERQGKIGDAIGLLESAIGHQAFAQQSAPQSNRYREFLQQHRDELARLTSDTVPIPADNSQLHDSTVLLRSLGSETR